MGLLSTALLAGAGRGLGVLGDGMLRQVERDAEQGIWEKRQALLQQIARENRVDQAAFDDARFPTLLDQRKQTVAAEGEARTAADVARLNNPELQGAQADAKRREQENEIALLTARRNDPRVQAAEKADIDRKLDILKRETSIRTQGQINAAVGSARGVQQVRDEADAKGRTNPLIQKFNDYEQATGLKLEPEVKKLLADAYLGLNKPADGKQLAAAVESVLKKHADGSLPADQVGAELRTLVQSLNSAMEKPTLAQAHADAAAAIKAGSPKEAVNAELRKMGFDPLPETPASKVTSGSGLLGNGSGKAEARDVIGNQPIGPLTRQADIEESARAGNRRAIEYLKRQERARIENATTPRDAASMMNG